MELNMESVAFRNSVSLWLWTASTDQDGSFNEVCDDLVVFGAYHSVVFDHTTGRLTLFGGQCCVNGPYEYYNDVTWSLFWWHDFAPRITLGNELSQGAVFFLNLSLLA